jgi:hypothetical protein
VWKKGTNKFAGYFLCVLADTDIPVTYGAEQIMAYALLNS